jgi:hypothetical protein
MGAVGDLAMRFSRVKAKLPKGVVIVSENRLGLKAFDDLFAPVTERISSNYPLELTLEAPEGTETELAKLLRGMAAELDSKQ